MHWKDRLADRISLLSPSAAVIEILKLSERSDVVSFSGGLPDPAIFSLEKIAECTSRVMTDQGHEALNYGPNPGYARLREWLVGWMEEREGVKSSTDGIQVTTGGLEALHLVCLALLDPGECVVVGAPTYLAALHVFRAHQVQIESVDVDEEGLNPDSLKDCLLRLERTGKRAKFLYLVPTFQNPTGVTLSTARRKKILDLCRRFDLPIVEDNAYADLRYDGEPVPSFRSLAPEMVIFLHTFSKIFGPGIRLGWIAADPSLISTLGLCKLGTDQCPNTLTQRILYECAIEGCIDEHISRSIELYRGKRDTLLEELNSQMPAGVSWTSPEGGFYTWLSLPEGISSSRLFKEALEKEKVAFVAGSPFFDGRSGERFARLSFSYIPRDEIAEGISRLAKLIREG